MIVLLLLWAVTKWYTFFLKNFIISITGILQSSSHQATMLLQSGPTSLNHSELILQSSSSSSSSTTPAQSTTAHSAFLNHPQAPSSITSSSSSSSTPPNKDISRYVDAIQEQLKEGWTVHTAKDGRLYYCKWVPATYIEPFYCSRCNLQREN